jgi:predicted methyltransferase
MLEFIGIRPGIVAVDLSAAGGYTTELLARSETHNSGELWQIRLDSPNRVANSGEAY